MSLMEQHNLTLLIEPNTPPPPSTGTSTSRDISPDFSLVAGTLDISWGNTGANMGSDHDLLVVTSKGPTFKAKTGLARITSRD